MTVNKEAFKDNANTKVNVNTNAKKNESDSASVVTADLSSPTNLASATAPTGRGKENSSLYPAQDDGSHGADVVAQTNNKNKKNVPFEIKIKTLQKLQALFPKTFCRERPLPLKIGIDKEIIAHKDFDEPRAHLGGALSHHCKSIPYLRSVVKMKKRFDITGAEVEDIQDSIIDLSQKFLDIKLKHKRKDNNKEEGEQKQKDN